MSKKKVFIIVSILAAIGLVVMLFMLPKPKTNNSAKHETSTETSSSKESSKKNDDKKNQTSKKDDKKKDDTGKKEDTSTTSETPVTPTTGTTSTEVQNNNNSSSVTNTPSTNTTPDPQPIYQTIHHEEVGHWETQVIAEAWDEPVYERKIIGNQTGRIYGSTAEFFNQDEDGSYHVGDVQVGTTHHDAVTQQVWVVDQYAWDETIIVGYR
jgi:FtsZ-interacting cell division protein ZipA